jgi:hypothetical protein
VIIFCGVSHNFARVAEWHTRGTQNPFEVLAANRTKTQHSEIACVYRGFPHSHYALPRNQTHRIEKPTDASERAEVGNCGFTEQGRAGLCNGYATNGQPLSVHFSQSAYSGQRIIHLLPLFSRNKGIERTRLNCILGYLQASLE